MRSFAAALVVACVSTLACLESMRSEVSEPAPVAVQVDELARRPCWPSVIPLAPAPALAPLTLPTAAWCEPVDPIACDPTATACPSAPDGVPMHCKPAPWLALEPTVSGDTPHVCVPGFPSPETRAWRSARLRVLVDAICSRRDGCDPVQLHAYLTTLAMRESTLRPWKLHRLAADRDANARAWRQHAARYADSPAAGDPDRWLVGRGYYGGNAAVLLHLWDASEIPEALCGEVEATLVHLRTARRRWARVDASIVCEGETQRGTAHAGEGEGSRVSWYDVSLANAGSDPCPGVEGQRARSREDFVRRARSRGLDPYAPITLASLGRDVPRQDQQRFASDVRRKMDAVKR